jgi:hypothetical protein
VTLVVNEWEIVMMPDPLANDGDNLYCRTPVVAGTENVGFVAADPAGVVPGSVIVTVSGEPPAFLTSKIRPDGSATTVSDAATAAYVGVDGDPICWTVSRAMSFLSGQDEIPRPDRNGGEGDGARRWRR